MQIGSRIRIGKRDAFWISFSVIVVIILILIRLLSHDGFSDSGRPVWKSANLGTGSTGDTAKTGMLHSHQAVQKH